MPLSRIRNVGRLGAVFQLLASAVVVVILSIACSSDGSMDADDPAASDAEQTTQADDGADDSADDAGAENGDETDVTATDTDPDGSDATAAAPQRSLQDEELATVTDLAPGEQVLDVRGNLVTVHGIAEWPSGFADLPTTARSSFPFFADVTGASDPTVRLVAIDVAMCAAGIDTDDAGAGEFFVAATADDPLSGDPVLDRPLATTHPVRTPSFGFPSPATCSRGWLPMYWAGDRPPDVARYVVESAPEPGAEPETHLHQWAVAEVPTSTSPDTAAEPDGEIDRAFRAGETVRFTEGPLDGTTVRVQGWAESIGEPSAIDGTRMVAVSFEVCPASSVHPSFGVGVDGWNVVAPVDPDAFFDADVGVDPEAGGCVDGWMSFAVPLGTVPTSFFASDGLDPVTGFAEWSLTGAALAAPGAPE